MEGGQSDVRMHPVALRISSEFLEFVANSLGLIESQQVPSYYPPVQPQPPAVSSFTFTPAAPQRKKRGRPPKHLKMEMPSTGGVTISTTGRESNGRKRKVNTEQKQKDPKKPKRATTAFFFFGNEERPKVKAANPEFKVTQVAQELGRLWRAMDDQGKERFNAMAIRDRQRYQDELKAYNAGENVTTPAEDDGSSGASAEAEES